MCGKLSKLHCKATLVSNRGEKVIKLLHGIREQQESKCGSERVPRMMTYMLCVENCQSYMMTQSCLPIAGRLFYIVRKFHGPRISECNGAISIAESSKHRGFKLQIDQIEPF